MIKLFEKHEDEKYIIIKILFIKITFKKKMPKSDIDAIVWWIPFKSLRNAVKNLLNNYDNEIRQNITQIKQEINKLDIRNKARMQLLSMGEWRIIKTIRN